ncbi:MAG: hypothetical protein ABI459_04795 [Deltaproteobacteria bacterium]
MHYGETLYLVDHTTRVFYSFSKILGGGIFDLRLSPFFDPQGGYWEQDYEDYRTAVMLKLVGRNVEFAVSNTPHFNEILEKGYERRGFKDFLAEFRAQS